MNKSIAVCIACVGLLLLVSSVAAQGQISEADQERLDSIGFDQKLDAQLPLDAAFVDEYGNDVQLEQYFGEKPVILVMAYYECPMLCTLVLNGLLNALSEMSFELGQEYHVVTISVDPDETPAMAMEKKDVYLSLYGESETAEHGWTFLTGDEAEIQRVTEAVGFRYIYDERQDEYAHPSGLVVLTPEGKVSRYLFGIEFPVNDLRLGLVEASANQIGNAVDQILLMCYHYDPEVGQYTPAIMNIVNFFAWVTVIVIAVPLGLTIIRNNRKKPLTQ